MLPVFSVCLFLFFVKSGIITYSYKRVGRNDGKEETCRRKREKKPAYSNMNAWMAIANQIMEERE
ncbi:hypothetical protein D3Z50_08095 [Clostridiaceae bacterium]|jgi:hypothetical protein|nr:hypothetical protein [Clostridiaceae bacterium]